VPVVHHNFLRMKCAAFQNVYDLAILWQVTLVTAIWSWSRTDWLELVATWRWWRL